MIASSRSRRSWLTTSRPPRKVPQLVEQPPLGREVEVIRRLVEHQRVGLLEEHPHEVDPPPLASRQRGDVFEEQALGKAQAVGQSGDAPFHLVAARHPVALLERGEGRGWRPRSATRPSPVGP